MKTAIGYTVLSLLNLIGFALGVIFLPPTVALHFDWGMRADLFGSPWVLSALPAAAAIVSAAIWAATLSAKEKRRSRIVGSLSVLGAVLICLGWIFFALAVKELASSDAVSYPVPLVTVFPLSVLMLFFGNLLPGLEPNRIGFRAFSAPAGEAAWERTSRVGGYAFFFAGAISAIGAVIFSCLGLDLYSYLLFGIGAVAAVLLFAAGGRIFLRKLRKSGE